MSSQDKSLQCSDCGSAFTFSAEEQDFFQTKGYTNEPKRCPECRQARKTERSGSSNYSSGSSNYGSRRQMFPAVCAECGKDTQVPFEPRGDRPVYCSDCYRKVKPSRQSQKTKEPSIQLGSFFIPVRGSYLALKPKELSSICGLTPRWIGCSRQVLALP